MTTSYLLRNVDAVIQKFVGMGYCVDDMQTTQTDKLQMMASHRSCTSQSHKQIEQTNRTKQDDVTSRNRNDKRRFQMLQSNSVAYGGPETG